MESVLNWSMVISVIGVLVVVTNIVVQVLKKVTWDKLPTNILAVAVSMVLTLVAFFSYCQIKAIAVVWYMVAAAVVAGHVMSPCSLASGEFRHHYLNAALCGHAVFLSKMSYLQCLPILIS
jgi:purine-cytosine permease-like protein